MKSAIYEGLVLHERMRPRRHRLRYRVFCVLIDLDERAALARRFKWLGIERAAPLSFRERDHGDGRQPLRQWVDAELHRAGLPAAQRVELLCYPRMFGFVFNPLSVYFCYGPADQLTGIIYEVHNTHGERHTYVLPAGKGSRIVRHAAEKQFFVSPFMPMDCTYRFRIAPPARRVGVSILEDDAEGLLLTASFTGQRRELTDRGLAGLLLRYPLMTLKVVAGIHWEAVKLLAKRAPWFHWSPKPARDQAREESPADHR